MASGRVAYYFDFCTKQSFLHIASVSDIKKRQTRRMLLSLISACQELRWLESWIASFVQTPSQTMPFHVSPSQRRVLTSPARVLTASSCPLNQI